jgi:hypothetical protein
MGAPAWTSNLSSTIGLYKLKLKMSDRGREKQETNSEFWWGNVWADASWKAETGIIK